MDDLKIEMNLKEYAEARKNQEKFKENFSLIFDHDFSGPVQHFIRRCEICNEYYGRHVRNDIKETINNLEDICYCEEGKSCVPHNAIDMFKRIIGEV